MLSVQIIPSLPKKGKDPQAIDKACVQKQENATILTVVAFSLAGAEGGQID